MARAVAEGPLFSLKSLVFFFASPSYSSSLHVVCGSASGLLPVMSSLKRSSGFGVGMLGGGVSTRSWRACIRWSRLLGFDGESVKIYVGAAAR